MVEQQKQRVEYEMTKLVDELDKSYLRRMQGDMHRCAAKCCDNTDYSLDKTHSCIEKCGVPLTNANNYVQGELSHMQNRLQRCVMQCNDDIRDSMGPNPTQEVGFHDQKIRKPKTFGRVCLCKEENDCLLYTDRLAVKMDTAMWSETLENKMSQHDMTIQKSLTSIDRLTKF